MKPFSITPFLLKTRKRIWNQFQQVKNSRLGYKDMWRKQVKKLKTYLHWKPSFRCSFYVAWGGFFIQTAKRLVFFIKAKLFTKLWVFNLFSFLSFYKHYKLCYAQLMRLGKYYFFKLRYKGKSFRWHHKKNALILKFGTAHLVGIDYTLSVKHKKLAKMKILLFGTNKWLVQNHVHMICGWRHLNIYHSRGLRFARQVVLRKHGKVSAFR